MECLNYLRKKRKRYKATFSYHTHFLCSNFELLSDNVFPNDNKISRDNDISYHALVKVYKTLYRKWNEKLQDVESHKAIVANQAIVSSMKNIIAKKDIVIILNLKIEEGKICGDC